MTRLHVPIQLRWGDLDAQAHINNATMFRLLEEARIRAFFAPVRASEHAPSTAMFDLETFGKPSGASMVIAHQAAAYLAPMPYTQEPVDVQMWFPRVGGSSLDVAYEIHAPMSAEQAVVYVRATTTAVLVDPVTGRPTRWPVNFRAAVAEYDEPDIDFSRR